MAPLDFKHMTSADYKPGESDEVKYYAQKRKKQYHGNESVQSADRKPEKYVKANGKVGIRMVRTDKEVIKKEAMVDPNDLKGRPKKADPNPESPYGIKHPMHPANLKKKKVKSEASSPSVLKPTKPSDITNHARTLAKNSDDYERNKKKYIDKARSKVFKMYPRESLNGLMKEESVDEARWPDEMPNEDVDEALNMSQRIKRSRLMKRLKGRIAVGRRRAKKKMANKQTLTKRSNRQARNAIAKKLTRGIPKSELTFARKQEIEKRLDKPALKQRIARLAKRMFKDVRKKEVERKKG